MFGKEKRPEPDAIEALIGARATFSGNLRCDGSVRIDGVIESGSITTPTNVIITASASVMADIQARVVSVSGAYKVFVTLNCCQSPINRFSIDNDVLNIRRFNFLNRF